MVMFMLHMSEQTPLLDESFNPRDTQPLPTVANAGATEVSMVQLGPESLIDNPGPVYAELTGTVPKSLEEVEARARRARTWGHEAHAFVDGGGKIEDHETANAIIDFAIEGEKAWQLTRAQRRSITMYADEGRHAQHEEGRAAREKLYGQLMPVGQKDFSELSDSEQRERLDQIITDRQNIHEMIKQRERVHQPRRAARPQGAPKPSSSESMPQSTPKDMPQRKPDHTRKDKSEAAERETELRREAKERAGRVAFRMGFGTRALERVEGLENYVMAESYRQLKEEGHDVPNMDLAVRFVQRRSRRGAQLVYAVDTHNKRWPVKHADMLAAYGHEGDVQGKKPKAQPPKKRTPTYDQPIGPEPAPHGHQEEEPATPDPVEPGFWENERQNLRRDVGAVRWVADKAMRGVGIAVAAASRRVNAYQEHEARFDEAVGAIWREPYDPFSSAPKDEPGQPMSPAITDTQRRALADQLEQQYRVLHGERPPDQMSAKTTLEPLPSEVQHNRRPADDDTTHQ